MKNFFFLLFFPSICLCQLGPTDLTGGYGANYGGLGGKLALGNILVVGFGTFQNQTMFVAGFRYPVNLEAMTKDKNLGSSYLSATYGGIGVKSESYQSYSSSGGFKSKDESKVISGWNIMSGYVTGGSIVFDFAIGYAFGKEKFFSGTSYEQDVELKVVTFDIGVGFRF